MEQYTPSLNWWGQKRADQCSWSLPKPISLIETKIVFSIYFCLFVSWMWAVSSGDRLSYWSSSPLSSYGWVQESLPTPSLQSVPTRLPQSLPVSSETNITLCPKSIQPRARDTYAPINCLSGTFLGKTMELGCSWEEMSRHFFFRSAFQSWLLVLGNWHHSASYIYCSCLGSWHLPERLFRVERKVKEILDTGPISPSL